MTSLPYPKVSPRSPHLVLRSDLVAVAGAADVRVVQLSSRVAVEVRLALLAVLAWKKDFDEFVSCLSTPT